MVGHEALPSKSLPTCRLAWQPCQQFTLLEALFFLLPCRLFRKAPLHSTRVFGGRQGATMCRDQTGRQIAGTRLHCQGLLPGIRRRKERNRTLGGFRRRICVWEGIVDGR